VAVAFIEFLLELQELAELAVAEMLAHQVLVTTLLVQEVLALQILAAEAEQEIYPTPVQPMVAQVVQVLL
jgi:hypothetical protein